MISEENTPCILRRKNASYMPARTVTTVSLYQLRKKTKTPLHKTIISIAFHTDVKHGLSFGGKNRDQKNLRTDGHGEFLDLEKTK
jgi:hypothetical protein